MNVKIFTEGGKNIGYGHISRCIALYDELARQDHLVEIVVKGEVEGNVLLKGKNIRNEDWIDVNYLGEMLSEIDYVIVDSYLASLEHYQIVSEISRHAVYIDDTARLKYPKGTIINPSLCVMPMIYKSGVEDVLCGPEYVILRSPFLEVIRQNTCSNVNNVLIVMGGTDVKNTIQLIVSTICSHYSDIRFNIVIDSKKYDTVCADNELKNVFYHKDLTAEAMCEMMLSSNLAITAAGQTIYELIGTRTPFIAIQVVNNQINNIDALSNHLPTQITLNLEETNFTYNLKDAFDKMLNINRRKRLIDEMSGLIDGFGARRITDALFNYRIDIDEIYLRDAEMMDQYDVFCLSNKNYVRKYSIYKGKIRWKDHVDWFKKTLQNPNIAFYIVSSLNGSFYGQIRFEIKNRIATVSISLSERLIGKGLSKYILSKGIIRLFGENLDVDMIEAYVSVDNIPSKKVFLGLEFEILEVNNGMIKLVLRRDKFDK